MTTRTDRAGAVYVWVSPGAGLDGFWMMRTPVTNAMWHRAVQAGAVAIPPQPAGAFDAARRARHPVVYVRRSMARAYAAWVGGRLPRDDEWTRAACGDDARRYPWGNQPPDATRANCRPHGPDDTTPVGSYPAGASAYGLLDLAGNVWELVDTPAGSGRGVVARGGSFAEYAAGVLCTARLDIDDDASRASYSNVGVRVVHVG